MCNDFILSLNCKFIFSIGGAWLVEQRVEQRRRFKAFLCAKPKDYAQIKAERKKNEKVTSPESDKEEDEDIKILDGFFLV